MVRHNNPVCCLPLSVTPLCSVVNVFFVGSFVRCHVQEVEVNAANVSVVRRNMTEMKNPPHVPEGSFGRYLVGQDVLRTGMCCVYLSRDGYRAVRQK
jgi:hypothetical protein